MRFPASINSAKHPQGSALLVSIVLSGILALLLTSYLYLTRSQVRNTFHSQEWNEAMVVAEAGIEDGLSMINANANSGNDLTAWPNQAAYSGWVLTNNNVYFVNRTLGEGRFFEVFLTNNASGAPGLKSIGYVLDLASGNYVARAVSVSIRGDSGSFLLGALLAKGQIQINGNSVIDSFNPLDPSASTGGKYDSIKRKANGNVASAQSNVVAIIKEMGSAKIYGKLATGPNSTATVQSTATVGDLNWVDSGNKGIQPGAYRNDLNVSIPDAPKPPEASYYIMPKAGKNVLNAMGSTVYYYATSRYTMTNSQYLLITNGRVVIDARAGLNFTGNAGVSIASNSQLIVYLGTENTQLNGSGFVNASGNATNCIFYGQTNCTQLEYNGAAKFIGYIYAPYADITLNGNSDTIGALVGKSFQINGNMNFHYDESLRSPQIGSSIYRISNWLEVSP